MLLKFNLLNLKPVLFFYYFENLFKFINIISFLFQRSMIFLFSDKFINHFYSHNSFRLTTKSFVFIGNHHKLKFILSQWCQTSKLSSFYIKSVLSLLNVIYDKLEGIFHSLFIIHWIDFFLLKTMNQGITCILLLRSKGI